MFEISKPLSNPFCKDSFKVYEPSAAPMVCSFCRDWFGTNASIISLNFNLFPDWDERWTVGVQFPDTQTLSQEYFVNFS